jgi:hypothetical protein
MGLLDTSRAVISIFELGVGYAGADFRAALDASCLRGALPPVDLRAVCLVRAMWYKVELRSEVIHD